jgi:peptidoglycan/LPS O-acetylase OafA/YrhL
MKYRPEIDGLRAIAVLPVIFFHAGFKLFNGGYVGVDVFFVISGYLITTLIVSEKEAGSFSIIRFYERRMRRILPALFFIVLVSILFAWLWLLPSDLKDFAESLVAVSTFWSNIFFLNHSGYFDTAAELTPLLHTWSLAVEEQYYVLFPLLILLIWLMGRRWIPIVLVGVTILSLAAAQWGSVREPVASFFLLQTRAWELGIGALVALYLLRGGASGTVRPAVRQSLSMAGLLMIGASVFAFDNNTPYPSVYTLLPTVGTALIVLFGTFETLVGMVLGSSALVGVGLISYSAYLWHQPIFAFTRYRLMEEPSAMLMLLLSGVAIALAFVSWRFVELPFRTKGRFTRPQIFTFALTVTLSLIVLGLLIGVNNGFASRMPENVEWRSFAAKRDAIGPVCELGDSEVFPGLEICTFGDQTSSRVVALYGDSHAQAIGYQLDEQFKHEHIKGAFIRAHECRVVPRIFSTKDTLAAELCSRSYDSLLRFIRGKADGVIVIGRWTFRLYPIRGEIEQLAFNNNEGGQEFESYREYAALTPDGNFSKAAAAKRGAVQHLLDTMTATGKPIILVYPIPESGWDVAKMNFFHRNLKGLSTSYALYKQRNRFVISLFDAYSAANLTKIKPADIFCDEGTGRCSVQVDSIPLYYDDDHLSEVGAEMLVNEIMKALSPKAH